MVFENATAGRNTGCRSVVNCALLVAIPTHPHLPRIPPKCRDNGNYTVCSWLKLATKLAECMTPPAGSVRRFTRRCVRELKNARNSVTVQNRTHVYMNFFHHKDLGNHLLQLCPKVVKHPVFITSRCTATLSSTNCSLQNACYLEAIITAPAQTER